MSLVNYLTFGAAVFLIVIGLIFTASGFGIFVVGRLDGVILIASGVAMFWGGWIISGAKSFPCAVATMLNMLDAASTVAFWNFEVNPIVVTAGPTLFLAAKIISSLTMMLYAKLHSNPRGGGIALSLVFAAIVGWNLSQHFMAYLGLETFVFGIILGTAFSFLASAIVLYTILIGGHIERESIKVMRKGLTVIILIGLLGASIYLAWEYNALNNYYGELYESYSTLDKGYSRMRDEMIFNMTLLMPKGLDEHYEKIRIYESAKFVNKGERGQLLFCVSQVLHDLGNYSYGHYCIDFNETVGLECENLTKRFAADFLDYVNMLYSNMSRIEQIYRWENYFVSNLSDTNEFSRFPIETLTHRCGDSEDQAMALSFLLEYCGYETALCMISDKNLTKYGFDGSCHVFCTVRKNNFEYDGTLIQLQVYPECGKSWVVLDSVSGPFFGADPEWMNEYRVDSETVYIPQSVLDVILVDYNELSIMAEEMGISQ